MLQSEVEAELNCCKISVDHLLLRQKQGFQSRDAERMERVRHAV